MYTFTPTNTYALDTHDFEFTQDDFYIKKNGNTVYSHDLTNDLEIKVIDDDFAVGSLTLGSNKFDRTVKLNDPDGGVEFDEPNTKIIGSDDLDDPGVTKHEYDISSCPIRIKKDGRNNTITITCPCDDDPCDSGYNACYEEVN